MILNYSYFEKLKRVICHEQKASPRIRFHQTNHLCKSKKNSGPRIEPCGSPVLTFPIQVFAPSEQPSGTYLIGRSNKSPENLKDLNSNIKPGNQILSNASDISNIEYDREWFYYTFIT